MCHDDARLIGQDGGRISRRKAAPSLLTLYRGLWLRGADAYRIDTLAVAPSCGDPCVKNLLTGLRPLQLLPRLILLLWRGLLMVSLSFTDSRAYCLIFEQTVVGTGRFDHGTISRQAGSRGACPGQNSACQRFE